jgi:hypothetical protein
MAPTRGVSVFFNSFITTVLVPNLTPSKLLFVISSMLKREFELDGLLNLTICSLSPLKINLWLPLALKLSVAPELVLYLL